MSRDEQTDITYRLLENQTDVSKNLYDLADESFEHGSPWTVNQFKETLEQSHLFYLIAEHNGEIIAFLSGSRIQPEAEIYNIVVKKEYKRHGIGLELIEKTKQLLTAQDVEELFLEVRVSNKPAILLYKKADFQPVGVRPNYYSNPKEDAVVLKCVV